MAGQRKYGLPDGKAGLGDAMQEELRAVSDACIECDLCREECAFLKKHGKPKEIADRYNPVKRKEDLSLPFECSLCALCTAVCPAKVDPARLFLQMRRETVRLGGGDYPEHAVLKGYERRGASRRYSYYALPKGCDTIFFPGCTLAGTRSEKVILVYKRLSEKIPSLGIVLDCCMKPSHDLGREEYFNAMFAEMRGYLAAQGVGRVIVACPNCYKMFARHGTGLSTKSIYEILAEDCGDGAGQAAGATVTVHDPCAVRFDEEIHQSVRKLIRSKRRAVDEMDHAGSRTLCCGEGGAVSALAPDLAAAWGKRRLDETAGRKTVTYCAGCANMLSRLTPTAHVLDILWEDEPGPAGRAKIAKPPLTYWKRLRLKRWLKKNVPAAASRERTFTGKDVQKRGGVAKFLLFLVFLAAVVAAVKTTGVSRYMDQQTLRSLIAGYGVLAPIVYMLVYAVAPALFLPGLPITIAGGILFGPLWGVVYAIIGATAGACIAFLISRYLAREWVEGRLKSPRWRRLDAAVEKHGWKVIAFTRLIPLFPFNLLNYAFGLTKIGFRQYAAATFICMLPGCIAFIVFSSSLLDLVRGKVSLTFVVGIVLVVLVSMLPLFYRRYKAKRGKEDIL
jgi:uncharacterized membrane protein YdjX (TVP38/TMEM64 family)/Fe-S oxidoreductase